MGFGVITDTSGNLPLRMLKGEDIKVLPFTFRYGDEEYSCMDIEAFDGQGYYDMIRQGGEVNTSQINPQAFIGAMEDYLKQGRDVLNVCMSSGISGAYNSSCIAASQLSEDYPDRQIITIDTRGASFGEGLVALRALELSREGKSVQESAAILEDLCERVYQVFTVDSLEHLRRTGRCSNISAFVGSLLNIKPILKGNENGQIVVFNKVRGRKKSIMTIANEYDRLVIEPENQIVYIAHADCLEDANELATLLKKNKAPRGIEIVMYEPVTGAHVGPGALALFFEASKGDRYL